MQMKESQPQNRTKHASELLAILEDGVRLIYDAIALGTEIISGEKITALTVFA